MKKKEVVSVLAEIVDKQNFDYFAMPGKIPTPEALFEVYFKTEEGNVLQFAVDFSCFNVLNMGDKGMLKYYGAEIISFSDKLREFHL
ncbi:MAG: DUF2500 family protein [Longicatena sp.]